MLKVVFLNKPASRDTAFGFFACSSMELKEIPHLLAEMTTSRSTCFAHHTVAEESLHLATIWILTMRRTTL